jgi:hypothetical protein
MKTLLLSIALFVATGLTTVFAQSTEYQTAMTDVMTDWKAIGAGAKPDELGIIASRFERIAGAEPTQWLPVYYAGLVYNIMGFNGKEAAVKDKYLDRAAQLVAQADKISPDNDEIHVLMAQIAQAKMSVDPMSRWQQYGPVTAAEIEKARTLNPENPRTYMLEGTGLMFTPEQFGGGPKTACPVLAKAVEKFATFKPVSSLHPTWGQSSLVGMMKKCQ